MWDPDYRNYLISFFEERRMVPPPNFFADLGEQEMEEETEEEEEEEEEEEGQDGEDNDGGADEDANSGTTLRQVLYGSRLDNGGSAAGTSSPQEVVNVDTQDSEGADDAIVVGVRESDQVRGNNDVKVGGVIEGDSERGHKRVLLDRGEIDGLYCPICFEAWSSGGDHHVCCLPCGHIYGLSCIKKWLRRPSSSKCPQCKKRCGMKDIRLLYASQIVAVDGELEQTVRSLKATCASLEEKTAEWSKREVEWQNREADLSNQIQFLEERTYELEHLLEDMECKTSRSFSSNLHCHTPSTSGLCAYPKFHMQRCSNKFKSQNGFHIDGARLFEIDTSSQIFVIARKVSGTGAAHVLTKVSLLYNHEREDIQLPENMTVVKDLKVSPHARHVLLSSKEKKLAILSMESNNTILMYNLPAAAWSCSWDVSCSHYLYAGLQNGEVLQFDTRNTSSHVKSLTGLTCHGIHSLHCLPSDSSFSSGAPSVLTASSTGLCQWNFNGSEERPYLVPDSDKQGVCISLAYSRSSDDIVASYRPRIETSNTVEITQPTAAITEQVVQGSHVHYKRKGCNYQRLGATCAANVSDTRLPKSTIIDGVYQNPVFASGDQLTCELVLQELPFLTTVECLRPQNSLVRDIKFTHVSNSGLLSCLCEDSMHLFHCQSLR